MGGLSMRKNRYLPNVFLAGLLLLTCLGALLLRTFQSGAVIPEMNLPSLVLLSLAALAAGGCFQGVLWRSAGEWVLSALLAAMSFALLPWAARLVPAASMLEFALFGGGSYLLCGLLFSSIQDRLSAGPMPRLASVASALLLFLASQCFTGVLL